MLIVDNTLIRGLKTESLLTFLTKMRITDNKLQFRPNDYQVFQTLIENGDIQPSELELALEEAIFSQAQEDYTVMTRPNNSYTIYPDHCCSPRCFGTAILYDKFTPNQLREIKFDHGDDAQSFAKKYGKPNLPEILREELMSGANDYQPLETNSSHCC